MLVAAMSREIRMKAKEGSERIYRTSTVSEEREIKNPKVIKKFK